MTKKNKVYKTSITHSDLRNRNQKRHTERKIILKWTCKRKSGFEFCSEIFATVITKQSHYWQPYYFNLSHPTRLTLRYNAFTEQLWCNCNLLGFKELEEIHANEEPSQDLRKNSLTAVQNAAQ